MSYTRDNARRGLTLRSVVITIVALFAMAVWIQYEEVHATGGPLGENAPPNSAVGIILILLLISSLLYRLRRSLRIVTAELVVIYAALIVAAPLMSQGIWHRFPGLLAGIAHEQDFKSYESLPPMLWPHGDNLVPNHQFRDGLKGFTAAGDKPVTFEVIDRGEKGEWNSPVLRDTDDPAGASAIAVTINRVNAAGKEVLVPGERYLFTALIRANGFAGDSSYIVDMQADAGATRNLIVGTSATKPSFANPGGFARVGLNPVTIPSDLQQALTIRISMRGSGTAAVQDIQFFNNEAIEGLYSGIQIVRESEADGLGPNERGVLHVRPDSLHGLRGFVYLLKGYIPLEQWLRPAVAWTILISAIFLALYGANILMRRQWVANERFTLPLTYFPKMLFATETDANGKRYLPIFRNRIMWIGFGIAFVIALLKGFHFYNPDIPAPVFPPVPFSENVQAPWMKALLANVGIGLSIGAGISLVVLAVALLVETDILFSLWSMFLLFQFWFMFGKTANMNAIPGYPWRHEQNIGGYIAYALLAVWVARSHLLRLLRLVVGKGGQTEEERDERRTYRGAILMLAVAFITIAAWSIWTRMGATVGLIFFGYIVLTGFALSKIRAECGAPFGYITPYFGLYFVGAIGGMAAFKATGLLVATMASGFMCVSVFLLIAPAQLEMIEVGRHFNVRRRDVGAGLWMGLLGGIFIGGFAVLCWSYAIGANNMEYKWPYTQNWYYNDYRAAEANADRAFASGTIGEAPESQPLNFVKNPKAKGIGIGAVITVIIAVVRARFAWFPFHPVGYVLAPTFFIMGTWFPIFLAWLIRSILLKIGGARMIRHGIVPCAIGIFLGAIASIVFFDIIGLYLRAQGVTKVYASIP
tara:strand:+ start:1143 stop:3755 length:2613 start_codon:yes stop_codon:yes gene_type:complete